MLESQSSCSRRTAFFGLLSCIATIWLSAFATADDTLDKHLANYCYDCHSGSSPDGGLNIRDLPQSLSGAASFATWERIYDRIATREMPPTDYEGLRQDDYDAFTKLLAGRLTNAHQNVKGTVLRRLNRREYTNTLNDIFGTHLDLADLLPADGRSHEFDNIGSALSISMSQLEQYIASVDAVLDASIVNSLAPLPSQTITTGYSETREAEKFIGDVWKQLDDGSVVFFRSGGYPTGMIRTASASTDGYYRIKVTGYAYQSTSPITFAIGATTFQRGLPKPTFAYESFAPGKPQTIELQAWLPARYMLEITPWGIRDENYELKDGGIKNYTGPGLAIKQVQLEGPITKLWPSQGHDLLFAGLNRREKQPANKSQRSKSWYVPEFELASNTLQADVGRALVRVASKAFRRDVDASEIQEYLTLFRNQLAQGDKTETAYRTAITAIFCSPDFLYLHEPAGPLGDFALASRLSYMLHRTLPDAPLLQAASKGSLSASTEQLAEQASRMIASPLFERFVDDFTSSWLNLREINFTTPDKTLFPEFDAFLQFSMLAETRGYFRKLIVENRPISEIVESDFAMLNSRLAKLYKIDGVEGPAIRSVSLPASSVRGGLLSQAAVLKVSANGNNTSPVVRGVFVSERILGFYPPPPPAGVNGVEPDIRGTSTLRELLAAHRDSDSCRNCHAKLDPPGFALESFNPIGGWRERFRSLGGGEPVKRRVDRRPVRYKLGPEVDASGEFPTGESFDNYLEFRHILAQKQQTLCTAFVTKLLTFGTGREMGFSDRAQIAALVEQAEESGYGMRDILLQAIQSPIFRTK